MATFGKTIRTGVAATLMLAALTTGAQGFRGTGVFNRLDGVQIRGKVVCAECSLNEVREAKPYKYDHQLFQLVHRQGQVVMKVNWVSDSLWWNHLSVPRLQVWGEDCLFEKLSAEKNLSKEVEITGIPHNSRILDISKVTIGG